MKNITIDGIGYDATLISASDTGGKHCVFIGNDWYELTPAKEVKKYIVAWFTRVELEGEVVDRSNYAVFIDSDSSEENLVAAQNKYNELIEQAAYSVNLCQIIESTDY